VLTALFAFKYTSLSAIVWTEWLDVLRA